jgi:hypothetical protein
MNFIIFQYIKRCLGNAIQAIEKVKQVGWLLCKGQLSNISAIFVMICVTRLQIQKPDIQLWPARKIHIHN